MEVDMRHVYKLLAVSLLLVASANAAPPIAGGSTIGVSVSVIQDLAYGWSVKKQALGESVFNDQNQKIGKIEDIIVAPNKSVSFAIVSTGGFLGMNKHDVAIPMDQFKRPTDGKIVLSGATKDTLKGMPEFEYAKKRAE